MRHVFRKYTSNRGSALFMVISTMTALLVSVMAMYFAMVSSRQTQYAVFNKMQASQSAQSIAEIVSTGLNNANRLVNPDETAKALLDKMSAMAEGDIISTKLSDFKSLDPNNSSATKEEDSQLGAYAVTITRKPDLADGTKMYDIAVISSVDGNRDVTHLEFGFSSDTTTTVEGGSPPGESELFAATGYVPNDAYLDGGYFLTNTFFDTEFTYIGQYGQKANVLSGNLSTGGSLLFEGYMQPAAKENRFTGLSKPTIWSIRGDLEINNSNGIELLDGSKVMIGGDARFSKGVVKSLSNNGYVDVYILGDFYLSSNISFDHANVYILGDYNANSGSWPSFHSLYVNGDVNIPGYENPKINGTTISSPNDIPKWDENVPGMKIAEVQEELGRRTSTQTYGKWVVDSSTVNDAANKTIQVQLNSSGGAAQGVPANKYVFTLAYDNGKAKTDPAYRTSESAKPEGIYGAKADYIGTGFTIDGFKGKIAEGEQTAIILDTGDDPDNVMAIRLKPYIDMDGDGKAETFSWIGKEGIGGKAPFTIIVKGRGSVVLDVAEGATYQECNFQQTMSYGWFVLLGGTEGVDANGHAFYSSKNIVNGTNINNTQLDALASQYILNKCVKGDSTNSGCSYTTKTTTTKCTGCNENNLVEIYCDVHGKVATYCPKCQKHIATKLEAWNNAAVGAEADGFCANRFDKEKFKTYLDSHPDMKAKLTYPKRSDEEDDFVYPNTNIYLVTCSESTDLRFAETVKKNAIMQNGFYGYIYAPYITYVAKGSSGNGIPRFIGGLVVSDYVIDDTYAFLACYPDKMPEDITSLPGGGSMSGNLVGKTTKSWKTVIGGYH